MVTPEIRCREADYLKKAHDFSKFFTKFSTQTFEATSHILKGALTRYFEI